MSQKEITSNLSASEVITLEQMVNNTCFCKLKEFCIDKNGSECMRHRNIYQEFMAAK